MQESFAQQLPWPAVREAAEKKQRKAIAEADKKRQAAERKRQAAERKRAKKAEDLLGATGHVDRMFFWGVSITRARGLGLESGFAAVFSC